MKSNNALNKVAPNCPLNMKLREIHDVKQSVNNSHMSDIIKKEIMRRCDSEMNQAWRWHYEGRPGYEIINQDRRAKIVHVLKSKYHLNVDISKESHLYATNDMINLMVVAPHEGTQNKWMLRVGPMVTFDRWANSTSIERFFDRPAHVAAYLEEQMDYVYKRLFESLSNEIKEERECAENAN